MIFQLAKMFIVVLIVFGVCWLPYHVYFLYSYYNTVSHSMTMRMMMKTIVKMVKKRRMTFQEVRSYPGTQHIFLAFFWLAMANSAINPCIYFQMNAMYSC